MKRLLLILSAFLCISGCNNQSETPIETPHAAIVANEESFSLEHIHSNMAKKKRTGTVWF